MLDMESLPKGPNAISTKTAIIARQDVCDKAVQIVISRLTDAMTVYTTKKHV